MPLLSDKILARFQHLLREASHCDPFVFSLASIDHDNLPTQRMITLFEIDEQGLVFFTDSLSRKGQHFDKRPHASACFYWHSLHQQVEFDGKIEKLKDQSTEKYWSSRERDSQISAWASKQSEKLEDRETLLQRLKEVKDRYRDIQVPKPPSWSAYRLVPSRVEFWKSGWQRLHERVCYEWIDNAWHHSLLYP